MQTADRSRFAKLITDALAYYRQDATKFTLELWWQACQTFDMEQVSRALSAHAMDPERGVYAPKVADVVRALAGTHTDRAQLAWGKTLEAMGRVGAYTDVVFDDPAIHAAIEDLGGWTKLCRLESKDLSYTQHRFCESHKAYTGRGKFDYPRVLLGDRSPDSDYLKKGLEPPKPALIGNAEQAGKVFHAGGIAGKTAITFSAVTAALGLLDAPRNHRIEEYPPSDSALALRARLKDNPGGRAA
jgi:hypothetical protein